MENKNYMKQVADMLGVELNEEINLRYKDGEISKEKYKITKLGFQYYNRSYKQWFSSVGLEDILCGNCTIVKFPKNTKIFSVFPVSGTTYATKKLTEEGYKVLDLDSRAYSHTYSYNFSVVDYKVNGVTVFPQNYIKVIKDAIGEYDFIFISTHKEVIDTLEREKINYSLVYPNYDMKSEWIGRCYLRSDSHEFCDKLASNWDQWIKELDNVTYSNGGGCTNKIFLNSSYDTRYLYDAIKKYYTKKESK